MPSLFFCVNSNKKSRENKNDTKDAFSRINNISQNDGEETESVESDEQTDETEETYMRMYKKYMTDPGDDYSAFYGIWIYAGKDEDAASIFTLTADVPDPDPYYVVTVGKYQTKEESQVCASRCEEGLSGCIYQIFGRL